jgi:hypothetical protein
MEITEEHKQFAREMLRAVCTRFEFPTEFNFIKSHKAQRHRVQELKSLGIARSSGDQLALTLLGLIACRPDHMVDTEIKLCGALWATLEGAYDEDHDRDWTAAELAQGSHLTKVVMGRKCRSPSA